jgi:hypothetical protein
MVTTTAENTLTWNPGLDNGSRRLADVYRTMPRGPASAVPWYVKTLENPRSPIALAGAVDLFGHDCIHIVLGRGLLQQDEAFVIGFTMGASGSCANWERAVFGFAARWFYRGSYRFSHLDRQVFQFAVDAGRSVGTEQLHRFDFRAKFHRRLSELRLALGLNTVALRSHYEVERVRWPQGPASARLPRQQEPRNTGHARSPSDVSSAIQAEPAEARFEAR